MRFTRLWALAAVMDLVFVLLGRWIPGVASHSFRPWHHWYGLLPGGAFLGITLGTLGAATRQKGVDPELRLADLRVSILWAVLCAVVWALAASLSSFFYFHTKSIIVWAFFMFMYLLLFAPIIAGYQSVPPHTATLRAIRLVGSVWAALLAVGAELGMGFVCDYVGKATIAMLGHLVGSVSAGLVWAVFVLFVARRLDRQRVVSERRREVS